MSRGNPTAEVFSGILLLLTFHAVAVIVIPVIVYLVSLLLALLGLSLGNQFSYLWLWFLFGIGLSQLLYVIPLCIYYGRQRQFNTMKGIIIGAILTALLNGGCFLMFFQTTW